MKTRIHLSMTAQGMDSLHLVQWGLTLITVGCLTLAGCIWWYGQGLEQENHQVELKANELRARDQQLTMKAATQGIDLSHARLQALPKEVRFAKQVRQQLGFSWTQFLNDLESAVPPSVSMESVKVKFTNGSLILSGSAKTLDAINQLVDGLESHSSFHHVVLSQHAFKQKKKQDRKRFVVFTMTVTYESQDSPSMKS